MFRFIQQKICNSCKEMRALLSKGREEEEFKFNILNNFIYYLDI